MDYKEQIQSPNQTDWLTGSIYGDTFEYMDS